MEHLTRDVLPSILIVEPDNQVRTLLENFFSRVGWACQSWNGDAERAPWKDEKVFDVVIADSISLEWDTWADLRAQQKKNPDAALVLLVNPQQSVKASAGDEGALCRIEKESAQAIESTLTTLVEEYQRVRKEGRLAIRPKVPMEAQITIETFTSRELAHNVFPFPILDQLHGAGLLDVKEKLRLQLALEEALANSLEHGNLELLSEWKEEIDAQGIDRYTQLKQERLNQSKYADRMVTIVCDFDCERLLIRITDQGNGFTPAPKPIVPVGNEDPAVFGRGIALIEQTVDDVRYSCGGRQITLVKNIFRTA